MSAPSAKSAKSTVAMAAIPDVVVTDHAIVRFLERVVGLDIESLREIIGAAAASGAEHGAPSVRALGARFMVRENRVIFVLSGRTIPHYEILQSLMRVDDGGTDGQDLVPAAPPPQAQPRAARPGRARAGKAHKRRPAASDKQ